MAKTIKNEFTGSSIFSEIDIFEDKPVPAKAKEKIRREVGELLVDETLKAVGNVRSPVAGGKYKTTLNKDYAAFKKANNLPGKANMEFSGNMLDALGFRPTAKGVRVGIFGDRTEAEKAEGHNDFSGTSDLPKRQFLPTEGQKYKANIDARIKDIVNRNIVEAVNIPRRELSKVTTKSEFWNLVSGFFPGLSRPEIRSSIKRSDSVLTLLRDLNLLGFLNG